MDAIIASPLTDLALKVSALAVAGPLDRHERWRAICDASQVMIDLTVAAKERAYRPRGLGKVPRWMLADNLREVAEGGVERAKPWLLPALGRLIKVWATGS